MEEPVLTSGPGPALRLGMAVAIAVLALLGSGCAGLPGAVPADVPGPTADTAAPVAASTLPVAAAAAATTDTAAPPGPPSDAAPVAPAAAPPEAAVPPPPPDPLPRGRLDPAQDGERGDLWERVRAGFAMPDLEGDLVRKWERYYAGQPDYVERMATRGGRYLFHIVEEVERREMPLEMALLPFIESAFNPQARSRAAASGMWQFMPATGKDFELRQNHFRDDRRDVLASTRAALDYLQQLHAMFGDWHLALAAYNWGPGNVQRALQRNRRARKPLDYTALRMPVETRNYVPKLQAVKNIVLRPADHALQLPPLENHPYFVAVAIERDIDVELAAELAGLPLEEFQQLNPQHNKPVILAAGSPQVLLPYDQANRFVRELPRVSRPLASWTAWAAPRTLTPADAARLVGMHEAELRDVNQIPPRMLVKAGSTLLVPRSPDITDDVAGHIADNGTLMLAREGRPPRRVAFKAGRQGDTIAAVARRYKVSAAQVAQWNRTSTQARFKPGQTVVVMLSTPAPRASGVVARSAPPKGKALAAPRKGGKPAPRMAQR